MRRSRPVDPNGDRRGHMKDIVSIRQRPAAVEDRAVSGHWEGDLLSGPNNSYIATLVERQPRLPVARPRQVHGSSRPPRAGVWIVHRRLRHASPAGRQGAARPAGLMQFTSCVAG